MRNAGYQNENSKRPSCKTTNNSLRYYQLHSEQTMILMLQDCFCWIHRSKRYIHWKRTCIYRSWSISDLHLIHSWSITYTWWNLVPHNFHGYSGGHVRSYPIFSSVSTWCLTKKNSKLEVKLQDTAPGHRNNYTNIPLNPVYSN